MLAALLKEVLPYSAALDITLLLPRKRLPLHLEGDNPKERLEHLNDIAEDIAEQIPSVRPGANQAFNYSFIQWFIQVVDCEFSKEEMAKCLKRRLWRRYKEE